MFESNDNWMQSGVLSTGDLLYLLFTMYYSASTNKSYLLYMSGYRSTERAILCCYKLSGTVGFLCGSNQFKHVIVFVIQLLCKWNSFPVKTYVTNPNITGSRVQNIVYLNFRGNEL
jgi:hypothetical protein